MNHTNQPIAEPDAATDRFASRLSIVNRFVALDPEQRVEVLALIMRELSDSERDWLRKHNSQKNPPLF